MMANALFRVFSSELIAVRGQQIRHGHKMRGKPPGVARTLAQRLEELDKYDPEVNFKVDIGFPAVAKPRGTVLNEQLEHLRRLKSDPNLERLARNKELIVDLKDAEKAWLQTNGPNDVRKIAEHYGVFDDLFKDAYFNPRVPLNVGYNIDQDEGKVAFVFRGNMLKPVETGKQPRVEFEAEPDSLWTLLLTCPDGNIVQEDSEYCHWFIGNIPGNAVDKGELIMDYMKPIPLNGTGYHRYVFVLYKQDKKLDFTSYKKQQPCLNLRERNWSTYEFYRDHQDFMTPAGLAFFQADWDSSVTEFFHKSLDMKEPICEYDFLPPYIRKQTWFPLKQPFNLYMDKYRDPKQVNKEYLLRKLKKVHPFKEPEPPLKYPNAQYIDKKVPSWLKLEITKERLGWGRVNDV